MQFVSTAVPFLPLRASLVHRQLCSSIRSAWRKIINNVLIRAFRLTGSLSPAAPVQSMSALSTRAGVYHGVQQVQLGFLSVTCSVLCIQFHKSGPSFPTQQPGVHSQLLRDELFLPLGGTQCIPQRSRPALGVCACSTPSCKSGTFPRDPRGSRQSLGSSMGSL